MKRIFVGIKASAQFRELVLAWQSAHTSLPVRWIADADLHMTLVPPWNTDGIERTVECIMAVAAGAQPFEAGFSRIAYAPPDAAHPSMLWAYGAAPDALASLRDALQNSLQQKEDRPFVPHVTLARFRREDFDAFSGKKMDDPILWKERVDALTLFESPRGNGGRYKALAQIPLGDILPL